MTKLNQILAIEKNTKTTTNAAITEAYHRIQKPTLFQGISKVYTPNDPTDTDVLAPDYTKVQFTANEVITSVRAAFAKLMDVTATRDFANCNARADVKLRNGTVILEKAPAPYLLFLEKQLDDINTFIRKLPVLNGADQWHKNTTNGLFETDVLEQHRQKKVPKVLTLAIATDKHPAQAQVYNEDVVIGKYRTVKFSGEVEPTRITAMLEKVEELREAVKFAREQANSIEIEDKRGCSDALLSYVFG